LRRFHNAHERGTRRRSAERHNVNEEKAQMALSFHARKSFEFFARGALQ
jgi:hypothetical protein